MTNINVKEFNLSASMREVRETIDALKFFKDMLLFDKIPYGEENAKSASEIFGEDYSVLSNRTFHYVGGKSYSCCGNNYRRIYRKQVSKRITYVNPENPKDTVNIEKTHHVYWREEM